MARYRKKPVEIEAVQFAPTAHQEVAGFGLGSEPEWYRVARTIDPDEPGAASLRSDTKGPHLIIRTLEGNHRADPGDWIIRGVEGELYPCKPNIFAATYEAVGRARAQKEQKDG